MALNSPSAEKRKVEKIRAFTRVLSDISAVSIDGVSDLFEVIFSDKEKENDELIDTGSRSLHIILGAFKSGAESFAT